MDKAYIERRTVMKLESLSDEYRKLIMLIDVIFKGLGQNAKENGDMSEDISVTYTYLFDALVEYEELVRDGTSEAIRAIIDKQNAPRD